MKTNGITEQTFNNPGVPRRFTSIAEVNTDVVPARRRKYNQLSQIEQVHAASLVHACHVSPDASKVSRTLAHHNLLQTVCTSLPLMIADFIVLWSLLLFSTALVERAFGLQHDFVTRFTALAASFLLIPIAHLAGLYPAIGISPPVEFRQLVSASIPALAIFTCMGIASRFDFWPYYLLSSLTTLLFAVAVLPMARYTVRGCASRCSWWGAPVLVFAEADLAEELYRRLRYIRPRGLYPVGVLLSNEDYWSKGKPLEANGIPVFDVRNLLQWAMHYKSAWLLIGGSKRSEAKLAAADTVMQGLINAIPNRVILSPGTFEFGLWDRTHTIGALSGLHVRSSRYCAFQEQLKRGIDILASGLAMIVFSPLILSIVAAIRLTSPGPIFYSQTRVGRGGRPFSAWKFRSMLPDAERVLQTYLDADPELRREWEVTHKLKSDPRVTWIGKLIRATSLDELPQLWNVFRGDMSIVGPRPIINQANYDAQYINDYPSEYTAYCSVRPGLTGLWQITCRNNGVYEMRIYWDMYYIKNSCFWLDLYIILRTIRTVLLREGAS